MKFILKNWYDYLIIIITIIKFVYLVYFIINIFLKIFRDKDDIYIKNIEDIKKRLNFIFNFLMIILLLYLFNPYYKAPEIDDYVKSLLFLYAIVLILNLTWNNFVNEDDLILYGKKVFNI